MVDQYRGFSAKLKKLCVIEAEFFDGMTELDRRDMKNMRAVFLEDLARLGNGHAAAQLQKLSAMIRKGAGFAI